MYCEYEVWRRRRNDASEERLCTVSTFEAAWGILCAAVDEAYGEPLMTTWASQEFQNMYSDAERQNHMGVVTPNGGWVSIEPVEIPEEDE